MKIKNFDELAKSDLRRAALSAAEAGLAAIDTRQVITKNVGLVGEILRVGSEEVSLNEINKLYVVGVGKCASAAGVVLEEILGERISTGIILDIQTRGQLKRLRYLEGDHPLPTERNVNHTREVINLLSKTTEKDLVIFLISGGGSTLLCQPDRSTCTSEAELVKCLFAAGADIYELNTLRKHTSRARGGWLARHAYPARVISLLLSDVPGNDLGFIASGPTVLDKTTRADARKILAKYDLSGLCDFTIDDLIETPKEKKIFERVSNILVTSNILALEAIAEELGRAGFTTKICDTALRGEAREVGECIAKELQAAGGKKALLYGGETTVTIRGTGKGGRNQELVLAALQFIGNNSLILSLASDGRDNSDFAGALCDIITKEKATSLHLDPASYLGNNNSYQFFEEVGDALVTGYTSSNVSDLIVAINA